MNGIKLIVNLYNLQKLFTAWGSRAAGGICLTMSLLLTSPGISADDGQSSNEAVPEEAVAIEKVEKVSDAAPPTGKALIKQAYELSRQVTSIEDLEKIVSILDQVDPATVSVKDAKYTKNLQAWALNAKGKRLVDDTDRLRRIGNSGEAEAILDEALEIFSQAIEKDDQRASSYQQRGVILAGQGKLAEAIGDFDRAIELKPDEAACWFNRAEVRYAKQEYELAAADYAHVLELNPGDVQALTGRAHCSWQTGQLNAAIADYQKVTEMQPGNTDALTNLADAQQAARQWEAADKSYRAALEANTSNARAYRRIAWMYATCPMEAFQKPQIALEAAKKSIKLTGQETAENMETLAAAYAANEQFDVAERSQRRAIELASDASKQLMEDRLQTFSAKQVFRQGASERR